MSKKNKHVSITKDGDKLSLRFDPMFYATAARRDMPPAAKVEEPKKGKGSYNRKEKYKRSYHSDDYGNSFYITY
jgi:hypothetical protein